MGVDALYGYGLLAVQSLGPAGLFVHGPALEEILWCNLARLDRGLITGDYLVRGEAPPARTESPGLERDEESWGRLRAMDLARFPCLALHQSSLSAVYAGILENELLCPGMVGDNLLQHAGVASDSLFAVRSLRLRYKRGLLLRLDELPESRVPSAERARRSFRLMIREAL